MDEKFKMFTEGVLVIASSNSLKEKYALEEFDYNFPDGIQDLIRNKSIIAITNSGGDSLLIDFKVNDEIDITTYDKVIEQNILLLENDELLILSHAEFTSICCKKGDYKVYGWPIKLAKSIPKGQHLVQIAVNDVSEEYEKYNAYFRVTINLKEQSEEKVENFICELCD